jgi:hypothetical protein
MTSFLDKTFCNHGISFAVECERCEMEDLIDNLKWMKRAVVRREKRLAELDLKLTPEIARKMRDSR